MGTEGEATRPRAVEAEQGQPKREVPARAVREVPEEVLVVEPEVQERSEPTVQWERQGEAEARLLLLDWLGAFACTREQAAEREPGLTLRTSSRAGTEVETLPFKQEPRAVPPG